MSYYNSPPDPRQNIAGISAVVVFHVALVYALVTGLATKVVDVIRSPIETRIIEELKEQPKPEPEKAPPPPVIKAPPPPFVPPPEVTVTTPPPPEPTIEVATPTPPPVREVVPTPPPVVEAPPPPPVAKPTAVNVSVACPTRAQPKLTPKLESINGSVKARWTIKGGKVIAVDILSSTPKGAFDGVVRSALLQYGCQSEGDQVLVAEQTFNFISEP